MSLITTLPVCFAAQRRVFGCNPLHQTHLCPCLEKRSATRNCNLARAASTLPLSMISLQPTFSPCLPLLHHLCPLPLRAYLPCTYLAPVSLSQSQSSQRQHQRANHRTVEPSQLHAGNSITPSTCLRPLLKLPSLRDVVPRRRRRVRDIANLYLTLRIDSDHSQTPMLPSVVSQHTCSSPMTSVRTSAKRTPASASVRLPSSIMP